jgi:hypothetical protein
LELDVSRGLGLLRRRRRLSGLLGRCRGRDSVRVRIEVQPNFDRLNPLQLCGFYRCLLRVIARDRVEAVPDLFLHFCIPVGDNCQFLLLGGQILRDRRRRWCRHIMHGL